MNDIADRLNSDQFDLEEYLTTNFSYIKSGHQINIDCVSSACDDHWKCGKHLTFNVKTRRGFCYKCQQKFGPINLILLSEDISYPELCSRYGAGDAVPRRLQTEPNAAETAWKEYLEKQEPKAEEPIRPPKIELPPNMPINTSPEAVQYLQKRRFDQNVSTYFNLRFCPLGPFQGRLIIPVYFQGNLIGYQGRDITGSQEPKYLFPLTTQPGDRVRILQDEKHAGEGGFVTGYGPYYRIEVRTPFGRFLFSKSQLLNLSADERGDRFANFFYNWDNALAEMKKYDLSFIVLVEGATDCWRLWSRGIRNVVATFGKSLKINQRRLLLSTPEIKSIVMFWDGNAHQEIASVADNLSPFRDVRVVDLPYHEEPDTCQDPINAALRALPWCKMSEGERSKYKNYKG